MEFGQEEIQLYCNDVLNSSLALIVSALHTSNVELTAYNQEQFTSIEVAIDDIFNNFTYYYYAYEDNYLEHPCFQYEIDDCTEYKAQPYMPYYSKNNAKSYYNFLIESDKEVINNNFMFEVKYNKKSKTDIQILFSVTNKEKAMQALREYLYRYKCDEVYNDYENIFDYKTQKKQLYQLLTEYNYNLNQFHISDIKYIKALLDCEQAGKLIIQNDYIGFNDNNELIYKCIIYENGFITDYENNNVVTESSEIKSKNIDSITLNGLKRLQDRDIHIISVKYHLENTKCGKVTYKDIAEYMSNNGIYNISENNVKQRVNSYIYNNLCVNDLTKAAYILKEYNMLKSY